MIRNGIRFKTGTLNVHIECTLCHLQNRKSLLLCAHFHCNISRQKWSRRWNYRCTGLKNKNRQTYDGKGCSHAKAINSWNKHAPNCLGKGEELMICLRSLLLRFEWFHKYQDLVTPLQWTFWQGPTSPDEVKAFIVEILSYILQFRACVAAAKEDWMTHSGPTSHCRLSLNESLRLLVQCCPWPRYGLLLNMNVSVPSHA